MTNQSDLSVANISIQSGPFPKKDAGIALTKKRCTPAAAGLLATFYTRYTINLAVLGELEAQPVLNHQRIQILKNNNEHLKMTAQAYAATISLGDWKRRLPTDAKRAFSFSGFTSVPDAKAFTFRLGHEVAEAALSAKKGPTDYLSALLRTLKVIDSAFVVELFDADSKENHRLHIHGVGCIPADVSSDMIQQLLAPKQNLKSDPPVMGYRARWTNEAVSVTELVTPGTWASYSGKEYDFTAYCLRVNPAYVSRGASSRGQRLYENIRRWLRS